MCRRPQIPLPRGRRSVQSGRTLPVAFGDSSMLRTTLAWLRIQRGAAAPAVLVVGALTALLAFAEPARAQTPAPPTGLTATPGAPGQIVLAWNDVATNETGYQVERSTSGSSGP